MKTRTIDVSMNSCPEFVMGETCALHPHFIFDPETGKGKLFVKDTSPVKYIKRDKDPGYAWVQSNNDTPPQRVRLIQLLQVFDGPFGGRVA